MDVATRNTLWEIGFQLDKGIFPRVSNGGVVLPSEPSIAINPLGKEKCNEYTERTRRSATESRPWAKRRERPSGWAAPTGPRQTSDATQVIGPGSDTDYREALREVRDAYPGVRMWEQGEGFWLWAESALLTGLQQTAAFLVGVSMEKRMVRSWGFWNSVVGMSWIGPRHTNFPDGSICAYDPRDFTWEFGHSLVNLLDIFSVWALRHLHLEILGRWPGPQVATIPYEVVLEVGDMELCPCGSLRRYADCCKEMYASRNLIADAIDYCLTTGGGRRYPPVPILQFVRDQTQAPSLNQII